MRFLHEIPLDYRGAVPSAVLRLVSDVGLLYGVRRGRRVFLLLWLIIYMVNLVVNTVSFIALVGICLLVQELPTANEYLWIILGLPLLIICLYFWLVVR